MTMKHGEVFRKVFPGVVSVLYLSLSLYSISCLYHCGFQDGLLQSDLNSKEHHSHDHHHNEGQDQQKDQKLGDILFCKFVHNVGNAAIAVSQVSISSLSFTLHEVLDNGIFVHQVIDGTHFSRGPPVVLS